MLPPPRAKAPAKKKVEPWPLPVRGRIEVRSGFVEHGRYRVEPFDGVLSLEPAKARLDVKEARMCGVSFPLELEVTPEHSTLDIHLAMKDQPVEKSLHCLTGGAVQITGNANLNAELHIEGRRPHLVRNLTGTAQLELRQGLVKKFALLGNILSVRNIGSVQRMNEEGFAFRTMHARGSFKGGAFLVDEAVFDSDALNLAATGRVDLLGPALASDGAGRAAGRRRPRGGRDPDRRRYLRRLAHRAAGGGQRRHPRPAGGAARPARSLQAAAGNPRQHRESAGQAVGARG